MPDPLLLPSIAALTGGSLLVARNYLKHRLEGSEERYMNMYGKHVWEANNMDLFIHCAPEHDQTLKARFMARLAQRLREGGFAARRYQEVADVSGDALQFVHKPVTAAAMCAPRRGMFFELSEPGRIRVVWNHMQFDGVGMWNALKPLFDPNPPIVPYEGAQTPPPFLPELLSLPRIARRMAWRGKLREDQTFFKDGVPPARGLSVWDAGPLRAARALWNGPFNLLTSALVVSEVFHRHPERSRLNVGLTAYFPFLEGRNRYGVFLCKVSRSDVEGVMRQIYKQVRSPLLNWGTTSFQAYALGRVPDRVFARAITSYRRKIDVLISSLPVGKQRITLGGIPTRISCHPIELTLPYYFLLVGTRAELHVSYTSRFSQDENFLNFNHLPIPSLDTLDVRVAR
ncbi:MAG: hypothetical protein AAFV53_39485 [Myxococcota bacterium]